MFSSVSKNTFKPVLLVLAILVTSEAGAVTLGQEEDTFSNIFSNPTIFGKEKGRQELPLKQQTEHGELEGGRQGATQLLVKQKHKKIFDGDNTTYQGILKLR